jgi:chaperonin cofactor prefoldin
VSGPKPPITLPDQPPERKLGPLFTPEQTREYTRDLEDSLERVKRALTALARKRLNGEQVTTVERIRTFQKQAEQARQEDLVTAVNLARRADLLAQDLLGRLP